MFGRDKGHVSIKAEIDKLDQDEVANGKVINISDLSDEILHESRDLAMEKVSRAYEWGGFSEGREKPGPGENERTLILKGDFQYRRDHTGAPDPGLAHHFSVTLVMRGDRIVDKRFE